MSCNLSKMNTYNVGRIVHDNSTGSYTAQLVQPPSSCPDTSFSSKKAELRVVEGMRPQLAFDMAKNRPVIIVPTSSYVEEVGSSGMGFGTLLFIFALIGLGAYLLAMFIRRSQTPALAGSSGTGRSYGGPDYGSRPAGPAPTQGGGGGTTVINNGSSNDGLLTGMMLGSMMSNNRSERIIERDTTVIERETNSHDSNDDHSYSNDGGSGSTYSSDDDSSSSSSFSSDSDSSSSFSSDSGSSDSGGSFSSDS
jgi:hypothetical protein